MFGTSSLTISQVSSVNSSSCCAFGSLYKKITYHYWYWLWTSSSFFWFLLNLEQFFTAVFGQNAFLYVKVEVIFSAPKTNTALLAVWETMKIVEYQTSKNFLSSRMHCITMVNALVKDQFISRFFKENWYSTVATIHAKVTTSTVYSDSVKGLYSKRKLVIQKVR